MMRQVTRGQVGGEQGKAVLGMKEGTCHGEHQVMHWRVQSPYRTPETSIPLYVNHTGVKILKNKNKTMRQYMYLIVSVPPFNSACSLIGLTDILIEEVSFLSHVLFLQLL